MAPAIFFLKKLNENATNNSKVSNTIDVIFVKNKTMRRLKLLYVYILKCADGSYYTGITHDMDQRLEQHNQGTNEDSYTYVRRPVELVFCEMFNNYRLAIEWEKRLKGWSRKKKEALINGNWDKLKELSKCRNYTKASPVNFPPWPRPLDYRSG
jgi:putative endonuclease